MSLINGTVNDPIVSSYILLTCAGTSNCSTFTIITFMPRSKNAYSRPLQVIIIILTIYLLDTIKYKIINMGVSPPPLPWWWCCPCCCHCRGGGGGGGAAPAATVTEVVVVHLLPPLPPLLSPSPP